MQETPSDPKEERQEAPSDPVEETQEAPSDPDVETQDETGFAPGSTDLGGPVVPAA